MTRRDSENFRKRDQLACGSKPFLYVLVGLPRSGKSTWANRSAKKLGATIVAGDDIRRAMGFEWDPKRDREVRKNLKLMVLALILRGQNVIVDETNHTRARRRVWLSLTPWAHVRFVEIPDPPREEHLARCRRVGFPLKVIRQKRREFEPVVPSESIEASRS